MVNVKESAEIWKEFPLWKLNYRLAGVEGRIFSLIKQGESRKNRLLKREREKRSALRKILLDKLKLWEKGKLVEIPPTMADILEKEKLKEGLF